MKFRKIEYKEYQIGLLVWGDENPGFGPTKKERERAGQEELVRQLLGSPASWTYEESGKPVFTDRPEHVSFSHSENVFACQVSEHMACGIDVQHYREKILRVAEKFLNENELAFLHAQPPESHLKLLTAMWSCKEALYKLYGRGFIDYINRFRIRPFAPVSGDVWADADFGDGERPYLIRVEFTETFALAFHTLSPTLPTNDNERLFDF